MLWVTNPKTQRGTKLSQALELERDYREWLSLECTHQNIEIMKIPLRVGKPHVRKQCVDCGMAFGSAIPHSQILDMSKLRVGTTEDQYNYNRSRGSDLEKIKLRHLGIQTKPGWGTSEYGEYLQSSAWQAKRDAVLKRANNTCEGCGIAPATVVHHHHYENIYDEWLWDLAALCRPCHSKCHPEHRTGDD